MSFIFLAVVFSSVMGSFYAASFFYHQRTVAIDAYNEASALYSDAVITKNRLEEDITTLNEQVQEQSKLLQTSDIFSHLLKQKRANNIFDNVAVADFRTARPNLNIDFQNAFQDVTHRLDTLYELPSGSPLRDNYSYVSSGYGVRRHPVTRNFQFHHGMDIPLRVGDNVLTTADGTVKFTGRKVGYGVTVVIDHKFGFSTTYAHLSKSHVKVGDVVRKGDAIALGGNTGVSTGPHIHYEVNYLGKSLNPYYFYSWNLENFDRVFSRYNKVKWKQIIQAIKGEVREKGQLSSLKGPS